MARPRTEFRNELKTRVNDKTYEAFQRYMSESNCASEARAMSDLLDYALFGMTGGSFPQSFADYRPEMGQFGTKTPA